MRVVCLRVDSRMTSSLEPGERQRYISYISGHVTNGREETCFHYTSNAVPFGIPSTAKDKNIIYTKKTKEFCKNKNTTRIYG